MGNRLCKNMILPRSESVNKAEIPADSSDTPDLACLFAGILSLRFDIHAGSKYIGCFMHGDNHFT